MDEPGGFVIRVDVVDYVGNVVYRLWATLTEVVLGSGNQHRYAS